jgi:hypothetical protein
MVVLAATDFIRHFDPLLNVIHGQIIAKKDSLQIFLFSLSYCRPARL